MTHPPLELAEFAVDVARRAGKLLMAELPLGLWRAGVVEHKPGRELVSRVDRASEQLIVDAVRERFPDHAIVAEEGGAALGAGSDAAYRWLIDPLDGTTNFLHGYPLFCVSVAVERMSGSVAAPRIVAGVVRLPYLDETYVAAEGEGAWLNSSSIRLAVSPIDALDDALVSTGFAYDRERFPNYDNFLRVARAARGIRRSGSAAIDLAFVAAGRCEAYWELGLRAHDAAAGALLVQQAGGRVEDLAGGDAWLEGRNLIASNGRVHQQLLALLDSP